MRRLNQAYRTGPEAHPRCRVDLDLPDGGGTAPTVVWFHGGGLTAGERNLPEPLCGQGLVVASAGYRLSPEVPCTTCIDDAAAAVAWVFDHVRELGGDPDRVVVAGASAGAYLAALVTLDRSWLARYGGTADRIAGLGFITGQAATHFAVRGERGLPPHQLVIDELAPFYHVRRDAPPILIVTGDRKLELFARYEENALFARMFELAGHADLERHELPGRDHGGVEAPAHPLLLSFIHRVTSGGGNGEAFT